MIGRAISEPPIAKRTSVAQRLPMNMRMQSYLRLAFMVLALTIVPAAVGLLSGCASCVGISQESGDAGPAATTPDPVKNQDVCAITDPKVINLGKQRNFEIRLALPEGAKIKEGAVPELYWTGVRSPIRIKGEATIDTTNGENFVVAEAALTAGRGTYDLFFAVLDESEDFHHVVPFKVDGEEILVRRHTSEGPAPKRSKRPRLRF